MWILMVHKRGTDILLSLIPDIRHITGHIVISKPSPHPSIKVSMTTRWFHLTFCCLHYSFITQWVHDTCAPQSAHLSFPPTHLSVHFPKALYHCSQLQSSPPPNTTKKPKMVRKITAFPVITNPQAPHSICMTEMAIRFQLSCTWIYAHLQWSVKSFAVFSVRRSNQKLL